MEDKDLVWEEIETEHIVQDEWIDFRKSTYKYPDGRVFAPYYSYSRRDYTVIVASDEDGKYLGFVSKSKIFNSYRHVLVHFSEE